MSPSTAQANPQTFTYPALLFLLLGISILAAADAGMAGDAVEAGDAIGGILPLDPELYGSEQVGRTQR